MKKRTSQILTVPNVITGSRFFLAGLLAVFMSCEQTTAMASLSFVIFFIAAVSDWIDGYYARRYQVITAFGKLMDPLADKVLVTTALIMLVPTGRLPAWVALVILCREIIVTGLRGVASSSGLVIAASGLGKIKSTMQYIGLGALIFPLGVLPIPGLYQIGLFVLYIALILTVWSGLDYLYRLRSLFVG